MDNDLSLSVQRALTDLVAPLRASAADPRVLQDWLASLGYPSSITADPALAAIVARVEAVGQAIEGFDATSLKGWEGLASLLQAASGLTGIFSDLKQFAASQANAAVSGGIADEIITNTVASWLRRGHARVFRIAAALGVIDARESLTLDPAIVVNDVTQRYERALDAFHFDTIGDLLGTPGKVFKQRYLPNGLTAAPDVVAAEEKLFAVLSWLADELGLAWRIEHRVVVPGAATPDDVSDTAPTPDSDPDVPEHDPAGDGSESLPDAAPPVPSEYFASTFPTFVIRLAGNDSGEVAFEVRASSAQHPGGLAGFLLTPIGTFQVTETSGPWTLTASAKGSLPSIAVTAAGVDIATGSQAVDGGIAQVQLKRAPDPTKPGPYMAGDPTGTRLELGALDIEAALYFDKARRALAVSFSAAQSAFVIAPSDGDGFLGSILPANGLRAVFDAGLELSSDKGLAMRGSAGLDVTIPAGVSVAGVQLSSVHLGLNAQSGTLAAELSATLAAGIGPVHAVIDRLGVTATLAFGTNGNVGIGDLSIGLKAPSGVGLSIDAHGVLTGGGFLLHDPAKGLYAGAMQLSLHDDLTLTAFGLISTRLPDGSRGYSLLIFITADGFEPVELGLGFMLTAIGGMIGINRTFDQDVIRAGLKNDTLKTLLFPRDPITNAPAVIQALSGSFPAKQGSYLLGLLARLTWFTPTLATFDLALILEFGARTRLLALGRVSILLPTSDNDLIRISLDSMGVLDFDAGTVALDATLVDSRLLHKFTITGSAALRAGWGSGPDSSFLLSVGGFNPHFTPPAGIPALDRVSISLSSGDNPKLHLDAYFAVTSNSVQFGAHASLFAKAGGFSISGDLGFDVLITHPPLKYIADFQASVQLRYESHNLFKLDVTGSLAGSKPTRLTGKASFSILWCDFSVPFDHTFDPGSQADQLPSVSGASLLVAAFSNPASWTVQRAPGVAHGVALRTVPAGAAALLDPLGQLKVTQLVVPLNTARAIDTINGAPLAGDRTFQVSATVNGEATTTPVQASFAPAHFFAMSDDDKLVAPSFQLMDSGLLFGSSSTVFDNTLIVGAPLEYDAIVLNPFPKSATTGGGRTGPVVQPPVAKTPIAQPPVTKGPVTPPIVRAPVIGPILAPPITKPPIVVAPPAPSDPPLELRTTYTMPAESLGAQANSGAAARVAVRRVGRRRYKNTQAVPAVIASAPRWAIVPLVGGAPAPVDPNVKTWTDYRDALATLNRAGAVWQLLPAHEAEG
jgi:hypothetical protein